MKMRFEDYKYTENKPRMFEIWDDAENIGLHQNKENSGYTLFSGWLLCM